MKKYKIYLVDYVEGGKDLENVCFEGSEEDVKKELYKLQEGYCEGEKPVVKETNYGFYSESACDFGYYAREI